MTKFKNYFDAFGKKHMSLKKKINILKEDIQVLFKKEGEEEPLIIGSIDDNFAKVLQRQILNKGGEIVQTLDKILKLCQWDKKQTEKEYKNKVLGPVVSIISENTDVDEDQLITFFKNKKEKTLFLNKLIDSIDSKSDLNILDVLADECKDTFSDPRDTIKEIIELNFPVSGVVTGKGEVAITMFSNAKKGNVGDLYFPEYGDVELKGTGGRVGKSGTPYNSVKTLPQILKNKGQNVSTGKQILKNADKVYKAKEELINFIKTKYNANDPASQLNSLINYISNAIDETDITANIDINEVANNQIEIVSNIKKYSIQSQLINAIIKRVNNFYESLKMYINSKNNKIPSDKETYTSTEVYKNFFLSDWGLTKEEIITGFLELKNEDNADLQSYRDGLDEILTPEIISELIVNHNEQLLRAIIGSLQTTMYYEKEKFKAILFLNNITYNSLPIGFEKESLKENFINTFDVFYSLIQDNKLTISLGIDSRSKGVNISYKG